MDSTFPRAEGIRNVAIVAHIDHGKTTLIDGIFRAAHVFRDNARVSERFMDSATWNGNGVSPSAPNTAP
jgi:GTP-binding protein